MDRLGLLCFLAAGIPLVAQTFEVASVKRVIPTGAPVFRPSANSILISGNRVNVRATSLIRLVELAYGVKDYQVSGGPDWAATDGDRWDIAAKAEGDGTVSMEQARVMLQNLLAERFHLKLRHQQKEIAVYNLVVAKGGPRLERAPDGTPGLSMEDIVRFASNGLDKPLIDKTGLTGTFLVNWRAVQPYINTAAASGEPGAVLTGVGEALGLKAEAAKAMADTLVMEGAEKPGEN